MVPTPSVDPVAVPDVNGLCVPETVPPDGTELHGPDTPALPPPSKVEVDPAVPEPPIPGVTFPVTDVPFVPQSELPAVEPSAPGLRPPGLSSVEPKGMPTWPTDPVPPSGDVVPIPGETASGEVVPIPGETVCDMAGAAPRSSVAAAINSRHRIEISIISPSTPAADLQLFVVERSLTDALVAPVARRVGQYCGRRLRRPLSHAFLAQHVGRQILRARLAMADRGGQRAFPVHLRQGIALGQRRGRYAAPGRNKNCGHGVPGGQRDAVAVENGASESELHLKAPRLGSPYVSM
jgi:hypothetical protein